jgi:hypothetical protein
VVVVQMYNGAQSGGVKMQHRSSWRHILPPFFPVFNLKKEKKEHCPAAFPPPLYSTYLESIPYNKQQATNLSWSLDQGQGWYYALSNTSYFFT